MRKVVLFFALLMLHEPLAAQQGQIAGIATDVLSHAVSRGTVLGEGDFEKKDITPAMARGALRAADAAGKAATRDLMAGNPVRTGDLTAPALVRRGEAVTVLVRSGPMTISAPGRALNDGAMGASIRVVNLATNRTLEARVEGNGRVVVPTP